MKNLGSDLIKGMEEAIDFMQGKRAKKSKAVQHKVFVKEVDIRAIRENMHLTRTAFASRYGFSPRTLQHWEQGDRKPHGAALILLNVIAKNPKAVEEALIGE